MAYLIQNTRTDDFIDDDGNWTVVRSFAHRFRSKLDAERYIDKHTLRGDDPYMKVVTESTKGPKMKSFKKFLESCEAINEAEYNKEWWDSKSDSFKKRYIERHPNSIYAQKGMSGKDVSYDDFKNRNKLSKDEKKAAWDREQKKYEKNQKTINQKNTSVKAAKPSTKDLDKNISDLESQLEALRKQKADAAEEERKKTWPKIKSAIAPYFNVRSSFAGDEGVDENDPNEWDVAKVKPGVELTPKIIKKVINDLGGVSKVPDGVLTAIAKNKNTPNDVLEDIYDSSDWDEAVDIAAKRLKKD